MAYVKVQRFQAFWDIKNNKGKVQITLVNNYVKNVEVESAAELAAVVALLNESTVVFDPAIDTIGVGNTPVGE